MLIIILFQCFINVFGVVYNPLGEYEELTGMLTDVHGNALPLEFNEPRWVTINYPHPPIDLVPGAPYPDCVLGPEHNWYQEEHPDIIGDGDALNPNGPHHMYPRYYIIKRRATIPRPANPLIRVPDPPAERIQILAMHAPVLRLIPGQQDRFFDQLLGLYCEDGFIETIDDYSRVRRKVQVLGEDGNERQRWVTYGTCGIEQKLLEICLHELGSLPMPRRDLLFEPDNQLNIYVPPPDDRVQLAIQLSRICERFVIIALPSSIIPRQARVTTSRKFQFFLKEAHQAGFEYVMVNGLNLGPGCERNQLGWEAFVVNQIANNEHLRTDLIRRSTVPGVAHQWYFCKYN